MTTSADGALDADEGGSPSYKRLLRLHEAAHAVARIVLDKTSCSEVQIGGDGQFEQGMTFGVDEANDPPSPLVRAVVALAGPTANVLHETLLRPDERRWMWRGTTGDYFNAVTAVRDGAEIMKAWDLAIELVEYFQPLVTSVAVSLEAQAFMSGQEIESIIAKVALPATLPSSRLLAILKTGVREQLERTQKP